MGTIIVIFAAPRRIGFHPSRVMFVAHLPAKDSGPKSKRARVENRLSMSFFEKDKVETIQPYDGVFVVTLRIGA